MPDAETESAGPPYRDWDANPSSRQQYAGRARPRTSPLPPPDGTGTVFVSRDHDDWHASWQGEHGTPNIEDFYGAEADVRAWALSRPAAQCLIFSAGTQSYIPLRDQT